jgi:hypothetical protein
MIVVSLFSRWPGGRRPIDGVGGKSRWWSAVMLLQQGQKWKLKSLSLGISSGQTSSPTSDDNFQDFQLLLIHRRCILYLLFYLYY